MSGERPRPPASFWYQADLIDYLIKRCGGADTKGEAWLRFDADDIAELRHLEQRLRRMSPHEDKIKRIVMGK